MIKLKPFDTARHLDNPEVRANYLTEALESGDTKLVLRAIQNIARANNMSKIARATGMSRTSLYWREDTSPEFTTVLKVLEALGIGLQAAPIAPRKLGERLVQAAREGIAFARGNLAAEEMAAPLPVLPSRMPVLAAGTPKRSLLLLLPDAASRRGEVTFAKRMRLRSAVRSAKKASKRRVGRKKK